MPVLLHVELSAPFAVGDLCAELKWADGSRQIVVLRDGRGMEAFGTLPNHLRLLHRGAPTGLAPLRVSAAQDTMANSAKSVKGDRYTLVEAEELFERGILIPPDGVLRLRLIWGVHCHRTETGPSLVERASGQASDQGQRFLASEHVRCAELVGMDASGMTPLQFSGKVAQFHHQTLLPIGKRRATFGQIIALAGDFYAYLDSASRKNNGAAWPESPGWIEFLAGDYRDPPLLEDESAIVGDILQTFERELALLMRGEAVGTVSELLHDSSSTKFPGRRYLALAGQNYCHFAAHPWDGTIDDPANEALTSYHYYHYRALAAAEMAGMSIVNQEQKFIEALVIEAFGCHFLTDMFASGHLRVPRRALGEQFGIMRGGLGMAHGMHDEDNKRGLWVTTRMPQSPRVVWRAFGDAMLFRPESAHHFGMVQEAVRRSVAEVFARYCGVSDIGSANTAEALLPIPLAAGMAPQVGDVLPFGLGAPDTEPANHFPLYAICTNPHTRKIVMARRVRDDAPSENLYFEQDGDESQHFSLPAVR